MLRINHLVTTIGYGLRYLLGCNKIWKLIVAMFIEAVTYVFNDAGTIAENILNYEMLDYVELKTGLRSEGVTMSVDALFKKIITNNIGTITGNAFLEWTGYTGTLEAGQAMPERFAKYMWPMYTLSNFFDSGVWTIIRMLLKYTPEEAAQVEKELNERRKLMEAGAGSAENSDNETVTKIE